MKFSKTVLPILLATLWISLCEFVRNQFWLFDFWKTHYENLGLTFPAETINGAVWGIWALVFAVIIYFITKKFTILASTVLLWITGFVMMWLVTGNMNVLPYKILWYAVPFSLIEVFGAVWITKKLAKS